jgi:hypothetical protein
VLGAVIASWPALALVGSYELMMALVRGRAAPGPDTVPEPPGGLNGQGEAAAVLFAADLAEGKVPGVRRIRQGLNVGQPRAQEIRTYLARLAASNGHRAGDAP